MISLNFFDFYKVDCPPISFDVPPDSSGGVDWSPVSIPSSMSSEPVAKEQVGM